MRIGYFITARLKSTRLKEKILLPLENQTVLGHVIQRCKAVEGIDGVVLCTSTNPQDSELYNYALNHKIKFYSGSEDDVLSRLEDAAKYYGYDAFVSITADNPIHSIHIAQMLIEAYENGNYDFIFTKGLPIGIAPYFIKTDALSVANYMKKETDTEIWGPFVNRPDFFNIAEIHVKNSPFKEDKRLTCDVKEDYELFKTLFSKLKSNLADLTDVFSIFKNDTSIWDLNKNIIQRSIPSEVLLKIQSTFNQNLIKGKEFAVRNKIPLHANLTIIELDI